MIFRDLRINKIDYSVLIFASLLFVGYFMYNLDHPYQLFATTIIFAIIYVLWGIWHHARSHHLNFRIVLEYFLIATLGVIIISTILI